MLPLLFVPASQQKPYQVLSIPCRCNRRTCHCLSHPQQCLSKAIFHLLHTYPSHHTGFLCNAVCTCTLFFHEFSYVKILSYFIWFVKGKGRKTDRFPLPFTLYRLHFFELTLQTKYDTLNLFIILRLTLVKVKNGYKSSNDAGCSHFPFGNDLCYFFVSSVLVLFIMLRIADFEINS